MRGSLFTVFLFASMHAVAQDGCSERVTTAADIGATISNLGLIGNAFTGGFNLYGNPSCEYPRNSGIEHLFQGGLWLGAKINGGTVAVSTGAFDASGGYTAGGSGFEFTTQQGYCMSERSSLVNSPYYRPDAVSHQDFVSDFSDTAFIVPGTSIQIANHDNPLGVEMHFESYNWDYSFANFFVILRFQITNIGTSALDSFHLGYWADGVVRNVNITPPGGSAFFNKGGNGFIDSLFLAYEFDAIGDPGFTDSYFGLKYLGAEKNNSFYHPATRPGFAGNFNSWQFQNAADPLYFFPVTDDQKFGKLTTGLNARSDWNPTIKTALRQASNRSIMVSAGSFGTFMPGEKIDVAFAVVCAKKKDDGNPTASDTDIQKENLSRNAFWAQTAYNGEDANFNGMLDIGEDRDNNGVITRYILPSPPDAPKSKMVARENAVDIYWSNNSEASVDPISKKRDFEGYKLYKTSLGFDVSDVQDISKSLQLIAQFDSAGNGLFFDTGFQRVRLATPVTFPGDATTYHYKYTFYKLQNGWQHAVAVTAFDTGDPANNLESLETSKLTGMKRLFPGKPGNPGFVNGDPFVYPNPYYAGAAWEGSSTFAEDKKIIFANLPTKCVVRIYTVAGDLVDELVHDENYIGGDSRWFNTYSDTGSVLFPGGEHAWDLLSADNQIIARGIYLFSVKDNETGKNFKGKFVLIK